jgi:oxygen-independent coproporphyrinogen-3 oxidase
MNEKLLARYSGAVPRYTSYPTAPQFHAGIDASTYGRWLSELHEGQTLSLYLHIPYCDRLCWFCACHTKQTLRYEPITAYLAALKQEISAVGRRVSKAVRVRAVHFGGGSPTMLKPEDMIDLMMALKAAFRFDDDAEIAVEMDPNDLDAARYDALSAIGLTRASLGVQDFDPIVQTAINRLQTFEQTRSVVEAVRERGVQSVNCDLLYGLPYQTIRSLERTVSDIVSLRPDRIALFGYAHVPWMKKHQTMIRQDVLPDIRDRFRQMQHATELLLAAGYEAIGIDHFALAQDRLAVASREGRLRRNFQGYTDDAADALIGLGASSIGFLPQGYVQNMPATGGYQRMMAQDDTREQGLATVRGIELTLDDRMRAFIIEKIMCTFGFDFQPLRHQFGAAAEAVIAEARAFARDDRDGICTATQGTFRVTRAGKPFARSIASIFDRYLSAGRGRHSIAV